MRWYLLLMILFFSITARTQNGYELVFDIQGFEGDTLYLGHHFGNKKYIADTAYRQKSPRISPYEGAGGKGASFVFSRDTALPGGMYLLVYPKKDKYFQFMLDTTDQRFRIGVTKDDEVSTAEVQGSMENELFFDYLRFLREHRPRAEQLRKKIDQAEDPDASEVKRWEKELESLDKKVVQKQDKILKNHTESLTAALIRVNRRIDIPEFEGDRQAVQRKQFNYFRKHYFDNIDMQDPRLIRTPMLFDRIDHFIENMTVQRPDSLIEAIDFVLAKLEGNKDAYRFFLSHFLNKYIRSEIVGMDAIYVHLVRKYYGKGKTPWVDSTQLVKMKKNAERFAPLLVGKEAPDITLQDRTGKRFSLHSIDSAFTVLFFWSPDCGHCQESMPGMIEFYEEFKDRGVEVFAVCTKVQDEVNSCWKYIDKNDGMKQWLNLIDPWLRSNFSQLYDIKSTPKIFVLDREKRIVTKRIAPKQLPDVMEKILEMEKQGTLDQMY